MSCHPLDQTRYSTQHDNSSQWPSILGLSAALDLNPRTSFCSACTSSYTSLSVATLQDLANDPIAIDMHQNLGSVKYLSQAQQCVTDTEKSNSCGQLVKGLTKENFQQAYFYILRCKLADFIYKGPKCTKNMYTITRSEFWFA